MCVWLSPCLFVCVVVTMSVCVCDAEQDVSVLTHMFHFVPSIGGRKYARWRGAQLAVTLMVTPQPSERNTRRRWRR